MCHPVVIYAYMDAGQPVLRQNQIRISHEKLPLCHRSVIFGQFLKRSHRRVDFYGIRWLLYNRFYCIMNQVNSTLHCRVCSSALPAASRPSATPSRPSPARTSRSRPSSATSTPAPPTSAPVCVHLVCLTWDTFERGNYIHGSTSGLVQQSTYNEGQEHSVWFIRNTVNQGLYRDFSIRP